MDRSKPPRVTPDTKQETLGTAGPNGTKSVKKECEKLKGNLAKRPVIKQQNRCQPVVKKKDLPIIVPWNKSFSATKNMRIHLHAYNHVTLQMLDLWHVSFTNIRLIKVEDFHSREESITFTEFKRLITKHIDSAKSSLLYGWLPEVHNIYLKESKRDRLPGDRNITMYQSFLNAVATLMTIQLQRLVLDSLQAYTNLISPQPLSVPAHEHPGFVVHLVLKDNQVMVDLDLSHFENVLLDVYELMLSSMSLVPRLESQLNSKWSGGSLNPIILPEMVEAQKEEVRNLIRADSVGPREQLRLYDKYAALMSDQSEEEVDQLIRERHSFQELMLEVIRFQELDNQLRFITPKVKRLGMFEVHSQKLILSLRKKANWLQQKLTSSMLEDSREMNKNICDDFETFSRKALSIPLNTQELVELKAYVTKFKTKEIPLLQQRLLDSKDHLCFLMQYVDLPVDLKFTDASKWYSCMPNICDEHQKIVIAKTEQYQDSLKLRYETFVEDLKSYSVQVEEFVNFGDLADLNKYLRKAKTLAAHLECAMNTIDAFNQEEEAFGWPITQYPLRKIVNDQLTPFLNLYETASKFETQCNKWLYGSMSAINPDTVEEEVSTYWQALYEMEKVFAQNPKALNIATEIKVKVEAFKVHIPLVQVLCNPRLCERHWTSMSEMVGTPLHPNEERNCVASFLPLQLEKHLKRLEEISKAA